MTEERGEETAVRTATSLPAAGRCGGGPARGGRLVKLLGDGAMLRFPEPVVGVGAAIDLVETMGGEDTKR
jgi:hypothetical protein